MLQGLAAPLRLVLQRSFADWLMVAATWLVILCATVLVAIGVLYGDAVAKTGLDRILAAQPAVETSIGVEIRVSATELDATEAEIAAELGEILERTGGEVVSIGQSSSYAIPGGADGPARVGIFASYEGIERHAMLAGGSWPATGTEPMEVAVSEATAGILGLAVGDEIELTSQRGGEPIGIRVAGLWRPNDPADPYWGADRLVLEGRTVGSSFVTHGPFVVSRGDLIQRAIVGDVELEVRALPTLSALAVDDVSAMRADTAALEPRLRESLGELAFFGVETRLDEILESAGRSLLVSRSGVVVLTIQFAVLAGYALLLVAGLLVDQRRVETALLRSRGAGVGHVALFSFLEGLVLVVPAVILAPWLASGVLGLLNLTGPLADAGLRIAPRVDGGVVLAVIGAGAAAVVGLVLPALGTGRGLAVVRQAISRGESRPLAQRLGIDLALVVLAGIGLWQLRQYGAPLTQTVRGEIGLDPLLVAAPAIGLLAGSIVALRIVPLGAEVGERLLARGRGLVAPLGARQLSRRPLRYTRSALLLMLAASLGTFAGAYASTWTRSQADQATYRTGSDVRVEVAGFPTLPEWAIGPAFRSIDGVDGGVPLARDVFDLQDAGAGAILALDSAAAASVLAFRPDLADTPLPDLMARLTTDAPRPGLALDAVPASLAIEVTATLEELLTADFGVGFAPGFRGITPSILILDADGAAHRLGGGRLGVGLGEQTASIELGTALADRPDLAPAAPVSILAIELLLELPEGAAGVGSVMLGGVTATSADGVTEPLELAPAPSSAFSQGSPLVGLGPAGPTAIRWAQGGEAASDVPIPALASDEFLRVTGAADGDVIELGSLASRRTFELVGAVRGFPTLDPALPFLVVDLGTIAAADASDGRVLPIAEWWLRTGEGAGPAVADEILAADISAEDAVARDDLHRDLISDPVALGVIGALALGALAAIAFAAIGFVVSATVSARERLGEFALLQAIGVSHRQVSAWLALENAFLLATGLIAGTGLGLVLAWVALPFVTLTQEATVAVPPVDVVYPWGIYALLYLAAMAALAVTVVIIGQLLGRVRVSGVLRSGGE